VGVVVLAAGGVVLARALGGQDPLVWPAPTIADTHVHEIVADPEGDGVLVGAHAGLFRLREAGAEPELVGELYHDLMGLEALADGRLIASGHPDLRTDLPVLSGFRVSEDGGRTWEAISLAGQADLHALIPSDGTLFAYDSSGERFLRSTDGGASWEEGGGLAQTADLVVSEETLLAATDAGLFASTDRGDTWERRGEETVTSLAVSELRLYAATVGGALLRSPDGGTSWEPVPDAPGEIDLVRAVAGGLWVATHTNAILRGEPEGRGPWVEWYAGRPT